MEITYNWNNSNLDCEGIKSDNTAFQIDFFLILFAANSLFLLFAIRNIHVAIVSSNKTLITLNTLILLAVICNFHSVIDNLNDNFRSIRI